MWRDDSDDLAFAMTLVDDLLDLAVVDEDGMRWHNVEFRRGSAEFIGDNLFQGGIGIGLTFSSLSSSCGDRSMVQWPHEPDLDEEN